MHRYIVVAASAAAAFSSSAYAEEQSGYFGLEGGLLRPVQTHVSGKVTDSTGATVFEGSDLFGIKYKTGYDVDLIGGYDLGLFRLEGELGYKRAGLNRLAVDQATLNDLSDLADVDITSDDLDLDGHARVFSGMVNGLLDAGGPRLSGYAGAGIGYASVKYSGGGLSAKDSSVAWQLIAGVRTAISPTIDFGVKYRYFRTGKLKFSDTVDLDGDVFKGTLSGHFSSHSLLASFIYHVGVAAPVAPQPMAPPPPPPTQTCPDGSVILATSACPLPAAPPPPPAPAPAAERGD